MTRFENHQWIVSDEYLETVPLGEVCEYEILRDDIFQRLDDGTYKWPIHMADKKWLDWPAFEAAFRYAVVHFAGVPGGPVDDAMLERSLEAGRNRAKV